jgi:hypothetical protein
MTDAFLIGGSMTESEMFHLIIPCVDNEFPTRADTGHRNILTDGETT